MLFSKLLLSDVIIMYLKSHFVVKVEVTPTMSTSSMQKIAVSGTKLNASCVLHSLTFTQLEV